MLVSVRQIRYTNLVAVLFTVVQGCHDHLCAGRGCCYHPRLLRRCFMPGKSPPCRILTLVAGICKFFLFREGKDPDFRPKQRRKPGREKHNQPKPTEGQRGAFLDKCRGQKAQPSHIEQSPIELPLHKKGTNQAAKNHPLKSRMGHGMGQRQKYPENTDKQKRPETA